MVFSMVFRTKPVVAGVSPRRIALMRLSAMGDCILLHPIALQILKHFPDAEIDWFMDPAWVSLFPRVGRLNIVPFKKPRGLRDLRSARQCLSARSYDVVLAMQASLRANVLYSFFHAPLKIGFDKRRARDGQWLWTNHKIQAGDDHLLDGFARFADVLGVPREAPVWNLAGAARDDFSPELSAVFDRAPVVGILPAASKLERTPTPAFWQKLLQAFAHKSTDRPLHATTVLLLGGPSVLEKDLAREILAGEVEGLNVINLVGKTSLYLLSGILRELNCLVSPDSGPAHMANAHKTSVIGLYGVAPSKLSGPYNNMDLVFDVYQRGVEQFLGKGIGDVKWGERVHNRAVMDMINPDEVADRLISVLES